MGGEGSFYEAPCNLRERDTKRKAVFLCWFVYFFKKRRGMCSWIPFLPGFGMYPVPKLGLDVSFFEFGSQLRRFWSRLGMMDPACFGLELTVFFFSI